MGDVYNIRELFRNTKDRNRNLKPINVTYTSKIKEEIARQKKKEKENEKKKNNPIIINVKTGKKKKSLSPLQKYYKQKKKLVEGRDLQILQSRDVYAKTRTGRLNKGVGSFLNVIQRGIVPSLYRRELTSKEIKMRFPSKVGGITKTGGMKTGRRGRPTGSYDLRYAKYGGVYGWRKFQAQQRRLQTLQVQRQVQVSPQQEIALSRMQRARESEGNMIKISPGGVATVSGEVPGMAQFHRDVKRWTNLVD